MSNNKQSMKLYTEEQVIDAITKSFLAEYPTNGNDILKKLTPIELPSDDEIYKRAFEQWGDYSKTSHQNAYREGAKWMRDKIQGGNNEQQ